MDSVITPIDRSSFDNNVHIVDPSLQGPVVILFWHQQCPHCTNYHPAFNEAAKEASKYGVVFKEVHVPDNEDLINLINSYPKPKFTLDGWPFVAGFLGGDFFAFYGPGPNKDKYRSVAETVYFAKNLGKEKVVYV
jgi:thiol-disulfide isomerase/thioredoxin